MMSIFEENVKRNLFRLCHVISSTNGRMIVFSATKEKVD